MPARVITLRLAFAAALLLGAWHFFGPVGLVLGSALVGAMLARPLMELSARSRTTTRPGCL